MISRGDTRTKLLVVNALGELRDHGWRELGRLGTREPWGVMLV